MKPIVHSSEIIHENPWYRIRRDELTWPNGKPGQYFVCEFNPSVLVICEENGKLLLVEQYRYTIDQLSLEFPMGGCKDGEDPMDAARREVEEETGQKPERLELIGHYYQTNGALRAEQFVYVAKGLRPSIKALDDSESDMKILWLDMDNWRMRIRDGRVTDCDSIAAWAIYESWNTDQITGCI